MKKLEILTNPENKFLLYYQMILLACVIILSFPLLVFDIPDGTLDISWEIGLHKAHILGIVHGRDVLFTYGPLGFLTIPYFISKNTWLYSAGYTLLVYILTLFSFALYIRKTKANLINTALLALIFIVVFRAPFSGSDYGLATSLVIFSYLYTLGPERILFLCFIAFLYSILPFIKFSYAIMCAGTAIVFLFILLLNRRHKEAFIFVSSSLAALAILSFLLIGSPKTTAEYIFGSLQIASGYSDAMAKDGDYSQLIFSAIAWLFYINLFAYRTFKKDYRSLIFLSLSIGPLFVSFKHGFVRHDDSHVLSFYSILILVFVLHYLESYTKTKEIGYAIIVFSLIILVQQVCLQVCVSFDSTGYNPRIATGIPIIQKFKNLQLSYKLLRGLGTNQHMFNNMEKLRQVYDIDPKIIKLFDNHKVDVFPWDIAFTEAYGFNWQPRPVFQSYSDYTCYLDLLNAKHFSSASAPEYILYDLRTIDGRYNIFDEPATFRELLKRYEIIVQEENYIILQKKNSAAEYSEVTMQKTFAKFNQIIPVPNIDNGMLFARINIKHNLLGHVSKFFYKSPNVFVGFPQKNNRQVSAYRFIYSNAQNGLFLSRQISSCYDLRLLWLNEPGEKINQIAFTTKHPAFFKNEITVEFFKLMAEP